MPSDSPRGRRGTIATIQAWGVIGALIFLALCGAQAWRSANVAWIAVPVAVSVAGHLAVLMTELCIQRVASRGRGEPPITGVEIVRAGLHEWVVALRTFCWRQPFRSRAHPDWLGGAQGNIGVVLLHGLYCNRGLWNGWMRTLRHRGVSFIALDLEPPFGSIDEYLPLVDEAVARMRAATGRAPLVVGHSMGGIAARAWLARGSTRSEGVRAITLGSPHHGTVLANFSRSTNARQMAWGSDWLRALDASEAASQRHRFTCFHSRHDNVVVPASSARLDGADNRSVPGCPHLALVDAPEVLAEVLRRVGR